MTTKTALTTADIERAAHDDRWLGFGYIGERERALDASVEADLNTSPAAHVAAADEAVLAYANERGWDYDRLFAWLNDRDGRHFADAAFDGPEGLERALGWGLLGNLGRPFGR